MPERDSEFVKAASMGDLATVQRMAQAGADIEQRGTAGTTALSYAGFEGHVEVMAYLLSRGADANAPGYEDCSPLSLASYGGHGAAVRLLLAHGADVARAGQDALFTAVYKNRPEALDALLEAGVPVMARTTPGWIVGYRKDLKFDAATPLHVAAALSDGVIIQRLLAAGAQPAAQDGAGRTAHDWAASAARPPEILALLAPAKP